MVLFSPQMYTVASDYKKIPLLLGVAVVGGSLLIANDIRKHNNLIPEASREFHRLKTGCSKDDCQDNHKEQIVILDNHEKRKRAGNYNAWHYLKKGRLAATAHVVWYSITHAGEDVYGVYMNPERLPDSDVEDVFAKTLTEAEKVVQFRSYDLVVLSSSLGLVGFGTYFYLKYKKYFTYK